MLSLHGFAISNYYNKVKLALLEKGIPFDEVYTGTQSTDAATQQASPLRKIPFIRTDEGCLSESQAILEYIEALWPQPPLLPADAFAAAKVRELSTYLDWHLEMTARQLYPSAFFKATALSEANATRIRKQLEAAIGAVKQLAVFQPFIAGSHFSLADCSAYASLPLVAMATKAVYGEDLLVANGLDYKTYLQVLAERPSVQKVVADRKAAQAQQAKAPG